MRSLYQVFRDIVHFRALIWGLAVADLKATHRDTILGNIWALLSPLMRMLVYMFIVMVVFRSRPPSFPLYLYSALITFGFFRSCVSRGANCIVNGGNLITNVRVPAIVLPASLILSEFFEFFFAWIVYFFMFFIVFHIHPTPYMAFFPVMIVLQLVFNFAFTLYAATIGLFFRDLSNILKFSFRLLWYLSPGLYTVDRIPVKYQFIYKLNPIYTLYTSYRNPVLYGTSPEWNYLLYFLGLTLFLLVTGAMLFKYKEKVFTKYV